MVTVCWHSIHCVYIQHYLGAVLCQSHKLWSGVPHVHCRSIHSNSHWKGGLGTPIKWLVGVLTVRSPIIIHFSPILWRGDKYFMWDNAFKAGITHEVFDAVWEKHNSGYKRGVSFLYTLPFFRIHLWLWHKNCIKNCHEKCMCDSRVSVVWSQLLEMEQCHNFTYWKSSQNGLTINEVYDYHSHCFSSCVRYESHYFWYTKTAYLYSFFTL